MADIGAFLDNLTNTASGIYNQNRDYNLQLAMFRANAINRLKEREIQKQEFEIAKKTAQINQAAGELKLRSDLVKEKLRNQAMQVVNQSRMTGKKTGKPTGLGAYTQSAETYGKPDTENGEMWQRGPIDKPNTMLATAYQQAGLDVPLDIANAAAEEAMTPEMRRARDAETKRVESQGQKNVAAITNGNKGWKLVQGLDANGNPAFFYITNPDEGAKPVSTEGGGDLVPPPKEPPPLRGSDYRTKAIESIAKNNFMEYMAADSTEKEILINNEIAKMQEADQKPIIRPGRPKIGDMSTTKGDTSKVKYDVF